MFPVGGRIMSYDDQYEKMSKKAETLRERAMAIGKPIVVSTQRQRPPWAKMIEDKKMYVVQWSRDRVKHAFMVPGVVFARGLVPAALIDALEKKTGIKGIYSL